VSAIYLAKPYQSKIGFQLLPHLVKMLLVNAIYNKLAQFTTMADAGHEAASSGGMQNAIVLTSESKKNRMKNYYLLYIYKV
jgi:hypothetical protein